jgi:uncharacterized protein
MEQLLSSQDDKTFIREIFDELNRGNPALWLERMSDDVVFSIIGKTRFSGTFRGIEKAMGPMQQLVVPGSVSLQIDDLIAEGGKVVMLARGAAKLRSGKEHNNTYAMVFTIAGGKIAEVKEYIDTALIDEVFGPAP